MRIIRTCKEMGIKTVALCPMPGEEANFIETNLADEYLFLEEEGSRGYLNMKKIVSLARRAKADAIHPGYGFLSENWRFAKLCKHNNIKFIGPKYSVLKKFEDKIEAKKIAKKLGIPTLPASDRPIKTKQELLKWAQKIKAPFILKAQKGGGGMGIRIVDGEISAGEILAISLDVQRQMSMGFSEIDFFLEKYLPEARHIEIQAIGDGKHAIHLGERECTIQRRFQKLIEEAPSVFVDEKMRNEMGSLAVKLIKDLKYEGVATVEFLVDSRTRDYYFMEVNPRIQVEHPVTEAVTGVDLVEQQIRIARGEKLSLSQEDIHFNGWAVEARINAEDPYRNFQPTPGTIRKYLPSGGQGVFLHTFIHEGQEIYPFFDSLLGKTIVWGKNRKEALGRLKRAIEETVIDGVSTTRPFFERLLKNKQFLKGEFNTDFIEKSGIMQEISCTAYLRTDIKNYDLGQLSEEDLAKLVFDIYKEIKEEEVAPNRSGSLSKWNLFHRLKMMEN